MLDQLFSTSNQGLSLRYQTTLFDATKIERPQYVVSFLIRSGFGETGFVTHMPTR